MGVTRTLRLPRLGETMEEARVVEWLKAEGSAFRRGEVLLEVETDKTVVEVPALQDGVLLRHLVQPGDTVELDAEIAEVEGEADASADDAASVAQSGSEAISELAALSVTPVPAPSVREDPDSRTSASPAARTLARRHALDLATVSGRGPNGRVQRPDVEAAIQGRPSGNDLQQVNTSSGEVAVRRHGAGATTVVFLHGLFADALAWRDLPRRVSGSGVSSLAFDLPGHGATRARPADLDGVAACIAEALSQLSPSGRCVLVGHSFGAVIAAKLAVLLGERVAGLVLSAPAGIGLRLDGGFIDAMLCAETTDTLQHALDMLGPENGPISDKALKSELMRLRAGQSGHAYAAALASHNGLQKTDIRPMLAQCHPVPHVVTGLRDRVLDWRDATNLPPRTAVHFCADAGHLPHLAAQGLMQELILGAVR